MRIKPSSPKAIVIVCCIASKKNLENPAWSKTFIKDFTETVCPIKTIWPHLSNELWQAPLSYQREICGDLTNAVFVLEGMFSLGEIIQLKLDSISLENSYKKPNGNRTVNINPGFIASEGLVLLSHKNSPIRLRVNKNVFLEKQQELEGNKLIPLENAFTEYTSKSRKLMLKDLLNSYEGSYPTLVPDWDNKIRLKEEEEEQPPSNKK